MEIKGNGKLLLTGEYVVLDGAKALTIPTKLGQTLKVKKLPNASSPVLHWFAYLEDDTLWFKADYHSETLCVLSTNDDEKANVLQTILLKAKELNPHFFSNLNSCECITQLEFNQAWGLGSSSTLLHLIGKWASVDPFELLASSFQTSGYDVAIAAYNHPIIYQRLGKERQITEVNFQPIFKEQLAFVYLNQKQNTQTGVKAHYSSKPKNQQLIEEISQLTENLLTTDSLEQFEEIIDKHESLLADHLRLSKVKDLYFSEYEGSVKSLGTWGGDFVLVSCRGDYEKYFHSKGYSIIIPFQEMIY